MKHDQPLTIDELKDLGFTVKTKKVKGEEVFDQCWVGLQYDFHTEDMVGIFYNPPSFRDIIEQVITNTENFTTSTIKEKITSNVISSLNI
jgi:hypothetical protein